jgi:putative endonuclease
MYYREKWYFIYIMTNQSKTLYIGITSTFRKRVFQHKTGAFEGFTSRYKLDRLVYWEKFKSVHYALAREKQLKRWTRIKKIQLIVSMNPTWKDLAEDWFPELKRKPNTEILRLRRRMRSGSAQDDN